MAKNYTQTGDSLAYTNGGGAAITSGSAFVMGARVAVALTDIAVGESGTVAARGVFTLAKLGTDVVAQGALLYWDATNKRLTTTSSGNTLVGAATGTKASGEATVSVLLDGVIR